MSFQVQVYLPLIRHSFAAPYDETLASAAARRLLHQVPWCILGIQHMVAAAAIQSHLHFDVPPLLHQHDVVLVVHGDWEEGSLTNIQLSFWPQGPLGVAVD